METYKDSNFLKNYPKKGNSESRRRKRLLDFWMQEEEGEGKGKKIIKLGTFARANSNE